MPAENDDRDNECALLNPIRYTLPERKSPAVKAGQGWSKVSCFDPREDRAAPIRTVAGAQSHWITVDQGFKTEVLPHRNCPPECAFIVQFPTL